MVKYGTDYYNPTTISQIGLSFINNYLLTNNEEDLNIACKYANKLIELKIQEIDYSIFPYQFNFELHGYHDEQMISPWASGMAQGQVLSLFSMLYKLTNDPVYILEAAYVFNSFLTETEWKIIHRDENNFIWINEYPMIDHTFALNGYIFAICGLYDYYMLIERNDCKEILLSTLTTIYKNINKYRNPGELSYYCLKHKVQSYSYHLVHIDQLYFLFK